MAMKIKVPIHKKNQIQNKNNQNFIKDKINFYQAKENHKNFQIVKNNFRIARWQEAIKNKLILWKTFKNSNKIKKHK